MPQTFDFPDRLQARLAMLAIGRSTLRSQGAAGMVDHARKFLRALELQQFSLKSSKNFARVLETQTQLLADSFPEGGKGNWGAARKSINIFLRDAVYCRPLCIQFKLETLEPWLELPLDSNSYAGLLEDTSDASQLPPWPGIKNLTPLISRELQTIANSVAKTLGAPRVHLDVRYWRRGQIDNLAG